MYKIENTKITWLEHAPGDMSFKKSGRFSCLNSSCARRCHCCQSVDVETVSALHPATWGVPRGEAHRGAR